MEVDLRKPLPWEDQSVHFLFAEHVVEHLTPTEAWFFFKECRRVLKAGGTLRVVVPSIVRVVTRLTENYLRFISGHEWGDASIEGAAESIIINTDSTAVSVR